MSVKRGFKQGDAFSNGLFEIAIDRLIRNIIVSNEIKMIRVITPRTNERVELKGGAYIK